MSINLTEARRFLARTVTKARYSAINVRNLNFTIDINYVMDLLIKQDGKCALTGWDMEFSTGGNWHGKNPRGATMDRIDNSKGYVPGNIQLTCGLVNIIKSSLNNSDFLDLCRSVTEHNK